MKETEISLKDEVKNIAEAPIENQSKYIKTVVPHQGHKCFEYNYIENELRYATMVGDNKKRVDVRKDCVYITALNYKNAVKHFRKMFKVDFVPVIVK